MKDIEKVNPQCYANEYRGISNFLEGQNILMEKALYSLEKIGKEIHGQIEANKDMIQTIDFKVKDIEARLLVKKIQSSDSFLNFFIPEKYKKEVTVEDRIGDK